MAKLLFKSDPVTFLFLLSRKFACAEMQSSLMCENGGKLLELFPYIASHPQPALTPELKLKHSFS